MNGCCYGSLMLRPRVKVFSLYNLGCKAAILRKGNAGTMPIADHNGNFGRNFIIFIASAR